MRERKRESSDVTRIDFLIMKYPRVERERRLRDLETVRKEKENELEVEERIGMPGGAGFPVMMYPEGDDPSQPICFFFHGS